MKIELIEQSRCNSMYKVDGTIVKIWTIVGGQIATSLEHYNQTKRWNHIPKNNTDIDSPKIGWIEDQLSFAKWLANAIIKQKELDARPNLTYRKAFKVDDGILIVIAQTTNHYVSITADLIIPIEEKMAMDINNNLIRELVATDDSPEYLEYIDTIEFFDNSLWPGEFEYKNKNYIYESVSCGCLHDEIEKMTEKLHNEELKKLFHKLIKLHLKDDHNNFYKAVGIINKLPKVTDINNDIETTAKQFL